MAGFTFFSKAVMGRYWDNYIEKSTGHKYIRKIPNSKGGHYYIYPKDFARPMKVLLSVFGLKEEKISNAYEKNNIQEAYGVNKQGFAAHLLEYLSNRATWNKFFSDKFNRERFKIPENKQRTNEGKTAVKNSEIKNNGKTTDNSGKEHNKDGEVKTKWNNSLMRKIYSMYNKIPEDSKIESQNNGGALSVGDKVSFNGRVGRITKDFQNGLYFVNFEDGGMGRLNASELTNMDQTSKEATDKADANGETDAEEHENRSQAMMGNQNAKDRFKLVGFDEPETPDNKKNFRFTVAELDPKKDISEQASEIAKNVVAEFVSLGFSRSAATKIMMAVSDVNYLENRQKLLNGDREIPEEVRKQILGAAWGVAATTKNPKIKEFFDDLEEGNDNSLALALYFSMNELAYSKYREETDQTTPNTLEEIVQMPDNPNTSSDYNKIGNFMIGKEDYNNLMNIVDNVHDNYINSAGISDEAVWTDAAYNRLMANYLKTNPEAIKDMAKLAGKYQIADFVGFIQDMKAEYDYRENNPIYENKNILNPDGTQTKLSYADINEGLSKGDRDKIYAEVSKISNKNGFSISADDLQKYKDEWIEATKIEDTKERNKKLLLIFSILEDSNWHTEDQMLLDGRFDDLQDAIDGQARSERVYKLADKYEKDDAPVNYFADLRAKVQNDADADEKLEAIDLAERAYNEKQQHIKWETESKRRENYKSAYEKQRNLMKLDYPNLTQDEAERMLAEVKPEYSLNGAEHELDAIYQNDETFGTNLANVKAKMDYLNEIISGYKATKANSYIPVKLAGNLPNNVTLAEVINMAKEEEPYKVMEKLYEMKTNKRWYNTSKDEATTEKWKNVQEIARLEYFKNAGLSVENGKVVSTVKDANGNFIKEGDVVKISNSYTKNENGTFRVRSVEDNNGKRFYLDKVNKDGTPSKGTYNSMEWPLTSTFSSNPSYRAAYREHNGKNGENVNIEITTINPELENRAKEKAKQEKGYSFTVNGIRKPDGSYVSTYLRLNDDGSIYVSSHDYGSSLGFLNTENDKVENDTDLYTDYHDTDSITVTESNPYYKQLKRAALKNEISGLKSGLENAKKTVEEYKNKKPGTYGYYQYQIDGANNSIKNNPGKIAKYESELKALEKELKSTKTVKKSMPMFIIKNGRFLVRK